MLILTRPLYNLNDTKKASKPKKAKAPKLWNELHGNSPLRDFCNIGNVAKG